jgi:hypothetical protein
MRRQEVSHLVFPGTETLNPTYIYIYIYRSAHFGNSQTGFSGLASTRKLTVRYPGCRNTEAPYLIRAIIISGFRMPGFRDMRRQEVSHLGFPGAETPKPVFISKLISGFLLSGFRVIKRQGVHALRHSGSRNTEVSDLCALGHLGVLHLVDTRNKTVLWGSRVPKRQNVDPSHTMPYRDFASRDFGTCEYKGIHP